MNYAVSNYHNHYIFKFSICEFVSYVTARIVIDNLHGLNSDEIILWIGSFNCTVSSS